MFVNFNILNQLGSPAINSNTFANRPAAGQTGRLFVSTDTFEIYRDNGTTWDLIGGPGSSTITGTGQATEVAFFTSSQAIASSANLFWDNTNQYLGIGTSVPNAGVNVQDVDALGVLSNITTVTGTSTSSVSVWAKNTTNLSGYAGIFEEITPNSAAGQYPIKISHTLSSGTAAANMATGIHFGLPDNTGTERINQLSVDTVDPIAATYSNRYRFLLRSNGAAVTPFYITGTGLGVFTATPGAALDIHSTGIMVQLNSTSATANSLLAFQRSGNGLWRIGDAYNGGNNYFELHNTVLTNNAIQVLASSNEATFLSSKTYSSGNAIGVAVQHNLTIPNAVNVGLAAIGGVNSNLNLTLGGSTTVAATGRQGLEGSTSISFTGAGTLTMTQGSTVRAFSALSSVYAFNGSAVGTITHLAGLRICFPDNVGSAVNITNNYALLINNQTTGTGTVTYTNRWGIYQEGASDLNYMAANLLLGSTVNTGEKLQVTGTAAISNQLTVGINTLYVDTVFNRVGIATTSPAYTLDVNGQARFLGNGSTNSAAIFNNPSGITAQFYAEFNAGATVIARMLRGNGAAGLVANGLNIDNFDGFQVRVNQLGGSGGSINLMGGNVGIGTTSPSGKFVVLGASGNTYLNIDNVGSGEIYVASNSFQSFQTAGSERMRITSGGNVLIGTTTDAGQKLQVNGTAVFAGSIVVNVSNGSLSVTDGTYNSFYATASVGGAYSNGSIAGDAVIRGSSGISFTSNGGSSLSLRLNSSNNATFSGSLTTAAPTTGTAAAWKLGSRVAATVVVNTTEYIEVDIGGTLYKLATVT